MQYVLPALKSTRTCILPYNIVKDFGEKPSTKTCTSSVPTVRYSKNESNVELFKTQAEKYLTHNNKKGGSNAVQFPY